MPVSDPFDDFVPLVAGPLLPAAAYRLWLELRSRGFVLSREDRTLVVQPADRLTADDCAACRHWKWHLIQLADYDSTTDFDGLVDAACARPPA